MSASVVKAFMRIMLSLAGSILLAVLVHYNKASCLDTTSTSETLAIWLWGLASDPGVLHLRP